MSKKHKINSNPIIKTEDSQAFITVNKGRRKHYFDKATNINTVYLNDGDLFQIELYNPTTGRIKAVLKVNGMQESTGLVFRPGERYFLERCVDTNNAFKFETYDVKNTQQNKDAIKFNGAITVLFYHESIQYSSSFNWWNSIDYNTYRQQYSPTWETSGGGLITNINTTITGQPYASATTATTNHHSNTANFVRGANTYDRFSQTTTNDANNYIETGRIEKGDETNQSFSTTTGTFTYIINTVNFKLLPLSQKTFTTPKEMKKYCTSCGCNLKNEWKFCANCGKKN
jgi:hypothetical protein